MHHVKSDARRQAYADPHNPFARYRPKKTNSATSRAEEGTNVTRIQSAPQDATRDETVHEIPKRHPQTDPYAQSRARDNEPGTQEGNLERFTSPEQTDAVMSEKPRIIEEHSSSSTEVPSNKEISSFGYPTGNQNEEKKKNHFSLPGFLGGKKKTETGISEDDDNGKIKKHKFTAWGQFRATILGSWVNVLLIFSPVGIALHFAKVDDVVVFVVNFIAIIPLAGMLSYATEEIALRTGEVMGGLLNASFGNAVELIVSIIALFQDQYLIVQTSLIGSMLSNLLLVLGMAFFLGGFNRLEQSFNTTVAQTASSLLFLAVGSLIIPTAFEAWAQTGTNDVTASDQPLVSGVLELSHATAVILLFVYCAYLFFQLKSHVSMYSTPSQKNKTRFTEETKDKWKKRTGVSKLHRRGTHGETTPPRSPPQTEMEEDDDVPEEPQLSLTIAIVTLAASTVLVALNAEFLVDSINAVTCESGAISKTFVGLILLPIVGNAAEHFTAVSVAIKDKMDLSIGVAVGSSMQIALLVLPFVVVVGWIAGKDGMTLYFDGFQLAMLFVAIILVNYLIQDGKSHWLEGLLLMMLYIIIAVAAWFYPTSSTDCGGE